MARAIYGFCQKVTTLGEEIRSDSFEPLESAHTEDGIRAELRGDYALLYVQRLQHHVTPERPCSPNNNVGCFLSDNERDALLRLEKLYGFNYLPDWRWHFIDV